MLSERATLAVEKPQGSLAGADSGPLVTAPVAVLAFNRPDLTARVFEAVRAARPRQLFLIADGPRPDRPTDARLCEETRAVLSHIDWDCEVVRKYEDRNLGCGPAVAAGISWVFDHVDRAIILEDDCLAAPSFFPFCSELLERYESDTRVMQIAGSNWRASSDLFGNNSYGFASFSIVWGWATWRRAWSLYDRSMSTWPAFRDSGFTAGLPMSRRWQRHAEREWDRIYAGEGTWDHQWQYCVLSQHGMSVYPRQNLVSNLGFRADATQTLEAGDLADIPIAPLEFPLRHPALVAENPQLEDHLGRQVLVNTGRSVQLVRRLLPSHRARRLLKRALFRRDGSTREVLP